MTDWQVHVDRVDNVSVMDWVSQLRHHPYFCFLDSSDLSHSDSRYSYIAFDPLKVLEFCDGQFELRDTRTGFSQIFERFHDAYDAIMMLYDGWESLDIAPFTGGVLALFSYEMYQYLDSMPQVLKRPLQMDAPMCFMGLYHRVLIVDHLNGSAYFIQRLTDELPLSLPAICQSHDINESVSKASMRPHMERETYKDTVRLVQDYIRQGDIYQLNFTYPSSMPFSGDLLGVYKRLRAASPVPYGAFFDLGSFQVLSASPELFFSVTDRYIVTRPIKGTMARDGESDDASKLALMQSEKDRAELMMIVDLERNDLGRVCELGSVEVPILAEVETFAYLHHMVATIKGKLRLDVKGIDIFEALFPGGSVTGTPKYRAMELIRQLETEPRSIYTGAIGYFAAGGAMKFNIPIRTMVATRDRLTSYVGSGLVADSVPQAEWDETICKGSGVRKAVQST